MMHNMLQVHDQGLEIGDAYLNERDDINYIHWSIWKCYIVTFCNRFITYQVLNTHSLFLPNVLCTQYACVFIQARARLAHMPSHIAAHPPFSNTTFTGVYH